MAFKSFRVLPGILIITISGILSDGLQVTLDHEVTYNRQSICGLKGLSVVMACSYTPPTNQTVSSVFWFSPKQRHHWWSEDQPEDLLLDGDYMGRVKYTGTEGRSSTLTITDLRLGDSGVYHCLYVSNEGRYSDLTGVNITVTDLQIKAVGRQSVVVSCNTLCRLEYKTLKVPREVTYLYFHIYKNGQFKKHTFLNKPTLRLSGGEGGSYSCAVGGLDDLLSPAVCVLNDGCWGVSYSETRICALIGSSVELSSSYTYPRGLTVTRTCWHDKEKTILSDMKKFTDRLEYKSTTDHSSLSIQDVRESDAGEYQFRFITGTGLSGKPGAILSVTGLQVKTSAHNVTEGQDVTLTCSTSCSLSNNPTFVWYKNGKTVISRHDRKNNKLYLISLNTEDQGDYSCGVKGHNLISSAVTLYIKAGVLADYGSEIHTVLHVVRAGIIILLPISLLCALLWIRKRRRSNLSERAESADGEDNATSTPVCSNNSPQAVDTDYENDA